MKNSHYLMALIAGVLLMMPIMSTGIPNASAITHSSFSLTETGSQSITDEHGDILVKLFSLSVTGDYACIDGGDGITTKFIQKSLVGSLLISTQGKLGTAFVGMENIRVFMEDSQTIRIIGYPQSEPGKISARIHVSSPIICQSGSEYSGSDKPNILKATFDTVAYRATPRTIDVALELN